MISAAQETMVAVDNMAKVYLERNVKADKGVTLQIFT